MRVFVTGAAGFIGSAIAQELIKAGHRLLGLARSVAGAKSLAAAGAEVHCGSLEDLESLRRGAGAADGVIHTAFIHDFLNYAPAAQADRRAIETIGSALAGSGRPVVTSGTLFLQRRGPLATEDDAATPNFPRQSEGAAAAVAAQGVGASVLRLPPSVHGDGDRAFVPALINVAREKGVSAYVGDGVNRWSAVHGLDAAHLYRLALERSGHATYHGVAGEGVPFREIAEVIGRRLNVPVVSKSPEEAVNHFSWVGHFVGVDCPASSQQIRELLGWQPTQPGLIPDPNYFKSDRPTSAAPSHR